MYRGRRKATWEHTGEILAGLFNTRFASKKVFSPSDFSPFHQKKRAADKPMKVSVKHARGALMGKKK